MRKKINKKNQKILNYEKRQKQLNVSKNIKKLNGSKIKLKIKNFNRKNIKI